MPVNIPVPPPTKVVNPNAVAFEARPSTGKSLATEISPVETLPYLGNGDEHDYVDKSASYSKGLRQQAPARVDRDVFLKFRKGLSAYCGLQSQGRLLGAYDGAPLKGPRGAHASAPVGADPRCHAIPAPPKVASREYAAELIELYWASLLRDVPCAAYESDATAIAAARELDRLGDTYAGPRDEDGKVTPRTLFRGGLRKGGKTYFVGEAWGPYVSQFLLHSAKMGVHTLDQKFHSARAGVDYLTEEADWDWIQNGGFPSRRLEPDRARRHIKDGRGLSAYARSDEAIQAYLVAHLILQKVGLPANPGSPYMSLGNERPFATFGAPDIVATLGAVARAALVAVGHQKWNVHLRHRPESGGALVHLSKTRRANEILARRTGGNDVLHDAILTSPAVLMSHLRHGSYLLSQAYPEGAPSDPSYPSGHGAVAGACITALKFFYDCERPLVRYMPVLAPSSDGRSLARYSGLEAAQMTFHSELGKLGHNVSFGSGLHAGASWRSDVDAGLLFGEQVAIGFLRDQAKAYHERFSLMIRKFDGGFETIGNKS